MLEEKVFNLTNGFTINNFVLKTEVYSRIGLIQGF